MALPSYLKLDASGGIPEMSPAHRREVMRAYLRGVRRAGIEAVGQWLPQAAQAVGLSVSEFRLALADIGLLDPNPLRHIGRLRRGRILELRRPLRGLSAGCRLLVIGRRINGQRASFEVLAPDGRRYFWNPERISMSAAITRSHIVLPPGRLTPIVRDAAVRALWD